MNFRQQLQEAYEAGYRSGLNEQQLKPGAPDVPGMGQGGMANPMGPAPVPSQQRTSGILGSIRKFFRNPEIPEVDNRKWWERNPPYRPGDPNPRPWELPQPVTQPDGFGPDVYQDGNGMLYYWEVYRDPDTGELVGQWVRFGNYPSPTSVSHGERQPKEDRYIRNR